MHTKTVQPSISGGAQARKGRNPIQVITLVQNGVDEQVAQDLYQRLTNGVEPEDKFTQAAVESFLDTVVNLTRTGSRLIPVC